MIEYTMIEDGMSFEAMIIAGDAVAKAAGWINGGRLGCTEATGDLMYGILREIRDATRERYPVEYEAHLEAIRAATPRSKSKGKAKR